MVKDEPVKDPQGFCQRVKQGKAGNRLLQGSGSGPARLMLWFRSGETGLLLAKVSALSPFFGYAGNKQLTEKKLLRNVFVKGDVYFNTGDLMAEDQDGFICFRDRVGDTFRYLWPVGGA